MGETDNFQWLFYEALKYTFPDLWCLGLKTSKHWSRHFFTLIFILILPLLGETNLGLLLHWSLSPSHTMGPKVGDRGFRIPPEELLGSHTLALYHSPLESHLKERPSFLFSLFFLQDLSVILKQQRQQENTCFGVVL